MTTMPRWCAVLAVAVVAVGLAACKSNTRRCNDGSCNAPTAVEQAPTFADVEPGYPPAAPSFAPDAPPIPVQSTISKAEFDAAKDSADIARRQADELAAQLERERLEREANAARIRDMELKIARMNEPPTGTLPRPDLASGPQVASIDQLVDDLRARSDADVVRDGDMVVVRVTNGFKAGSDLLKQDVQLITTLNATADALSRYPGATVAVVGHTDGDPIKKSGWESNDALSLARAQRVAQVLSDNGVDKNRISIDGQGFRHPLVQQERGPSDKARNRRVEIMIRM